jgi:hypothetical protein
MLRRRAADRAGAPTARAASEGPFRSGNHVEELGLVARAVVAQDRHDGVPRPHVARHAHRAGHVDARRPAKAEPLVRQQVEDDGQRLAVGDLVGVIGREAFQVRGDPPLPDPLGDRVAARLLPGVELVEPEPSGSDSATFTPLGCSACATPASVPPEPTAQMNPSPCPPVCSQISGPVVSTWACRLATLSNWLAQIAPLGSDCASALGQTAGIAHVVVGVRRAPPAPRPAPRPQGAACPSFPGSGSRGSRSPS